MELVLALNIGVVGDDVDAEDGEVAKESVFVAGLEEGVTRNTGGTKIAGGRVCRNCNYL